MLAAMLPGVSVFLDVRQRPRYARIGSLMQLTTKPAPRLSSHGTCSGVLCSLCCSTRLPANPAVMNCILCFQSQQVDNLRSIDALEEEISATGVVVIYASKGYFKSKSKRCATAGPCRHARSIQLVPRPNALRMCLHRLPPQSKRDIGARKTLLCNRRSGPGRRTAVRGRGGVQ